MLSVPAFLGFRSLKILRTGIYFMELSNPELHCQRKTASGHYKSSIATTAWPDKGTKHSAITTNIPVLHHARSPQYSQLSSYKYMKYIYWSL